MKYYYNVFQRHGLPVKWADSCKDEGDVAVSSFLDHHHRGHKVTTSRRICVIAEPVQHYKHNKNKDVYQLILTPQADTMSDLYEHFPNAEVSFIMQTHCDATIFNFVPFEQREPEFDVVFPGGLYPSWPRRRKLVQALRNKRLKVDTEQAANADWDQHVQNAKICIYVPSRDSVTTFGGQRLIYSIQLGVCTVGVKSLDAESEAFYEGCYETVNDDRELVDRVVQILEDGTWRDLGRQHLQALQALKFDLDHEQLDLLREMLQ